MNVVICADSVNTVVASKVCSPNRKVISLDVDSKIQDNMKLWTVNKNQIMD